MVFCNCFSKERTVRNTCICRFDLGPKEFLVQTLHSDVARSSRCWRGGEEGL